MNIQYKIQLHSDWHCGAGLNAGAQADDLVIKDMNNLPYIPGKTIKGLLKNSLLEIRDVLPNSIELDINSIFGKGSDEKEKGYDKTLKGNAFFSNAELGKNEQEEIIKAELSTMLYRNVASTKIEKKVGTAEIGSLRVIEVCIPLTLYGYINGNNINENQKELLQKAFKWTRHLGVNRNRGLGRCTFSILKPTNT